ncbi:hypothetical protein P5673_017910 [Acropora cervicornis]|uniref:Uncharacterized protein n=1 Tax=Acropora cervicornis TaxID=6130 RepID=A0AAD9V2Y1_ACRCE|nr:hypothetical protein P5673_017910 [Acropora cervicornis]
MQQSQAFSQMFPKFPKASFKFLWELLAVLAIDTNHYRTISFLKKERGTSGREDIPNVLDTFFPSRILGWWYFAHRMKKDTVRAHYIWAIDICPDISTPS